MSVLFLFLMLVMFALISLLLIIVGNGIYQYLRSMSDTEKVKYEAVQDVDDIDIPKIALFDQTIKFYIEQGEMMHAIEAYQSVTGAKLDDARNAVYYMARMHKAKSRLSSDTGGAGIQDLIDDGRTDEAIEAYRVFMGVDEFTAREAIDQMRGNSS